MENLPNLPAHYMGGMLNIGESEVRWLDDMRQDWNRVMRPGENGDRPSEGPLLHATPVLMTQNLANCKVFPDRYQAINTLKQGVVIAEVGTQEGGFARHMCETLSPKELHVFDIDCGPIRANGTLDRYSNIIAHEGGSVENVGKFPDKYFDIIYLDADHTYRGVVQDAEVASRKIKDDGIIVFNDYVMWSVYELSMYGVVRACNEFCLKHDYEMIYLALHPIMHCDVAIRKRQ